MEAYQLVPDDPSVWPDSLRGIVDDWADIGPRSEPHYLTSLPCRRFKGGCQCRGEFWKRCQHWRLQWPRGHHLEWTNWRMMQGNWPWFVGLQEAQGWAEDVRWQMDQGRLCRNPHLGRECQDAVAVERRTHPSDHEGDHVSQHEEVELVGGFTNRIRFSSSNGMGPTSDALWQVFLRNPEGESLGSGQGGEEQVCPQAKAALTWQPQSDAFSFAGFSYQVPVQVLLALSRSVQLASRWAYSNSPRVTKVKIEPSPCAFVSWRPLTYFTWLLVCIALTWHLRSWVDVIARWSAILGWCSGSVFFLIDIRS